MSINPLTLRPIHDILPVRASGQPKEKTLRNLSPSAIVGIVVTLVLGCTIWYYLAHPGIYSKLWIIVGANAPVYVGFVVSTAYAIWRWRKNPEEFHFFEIPIQVAVTAIALVLIYPLFYYVSANVDDVEIWNGRVVNAVYEESWTERVHRTCTRTVNKVTTSYDCSYNVYHPPAWTGNTSNGSTESFRMSSDTYERYAGRFGNQNQTGSRHPGQISIGDGRTYQTSYNEGDAESLVPSAQEHPYVNYVKGAQMSLHRRGVGNEKGFEALFAPYPGTQSGSFGPIEFNHVIVRGAQVPDAWSKAVDAALDRSLAYLGKERQVNVMVYVVGTDKPSFRAALDARWANGKKNDVMVLVGAPAFPEVAWADAMAWTVTDLFHVSLRDRVSEMKSIDDPDALVAAIVDQVAQPAGKGGYDRKPMEAYEYLASEIELPLWSHALVWIICGFLAWATSWALENNEFRDGGSGRYDRFSPRSRHTQYGGY